MQYLANYYYQVHWVFTWWSYTLWHWPFPCSQSSLVPTLILICYPFQCFQKCLSYYQIWLHYLCTFVDSFKGCYKDGTEPGTYDLCWLPSYGLILRLCIGDSLALTLSSMYFIYIVILLTSTTIALINFQPYNNTVAHYTIIDVLFLILLSLSFSQTFPVTISLTQQGKYILRFGRHFMHHSNNLHCSIRLTFYLFLNTL